MKNENEKIGNSQEPEFITPKMVKFVLWDNSKKYWEFAAVCNCSPKTIITRFRVQKELKTAELE